MNNKGRCTVIISSLLILFAAVAIAGDEILAGYVLKADKESFTVEDSETGQEVKIRLDKKTKVTGELKEDIFVEVEVKKGVAVSVKVVEGSEGLEEEESKRSTETEE